MSDWGPGKESFARDLDARDPLAEFRTRFRLPLHDHHPVVYFCGHSLGLKPTKADTYVMEELSAWGLQGVDAHFNSRNPWYSYHEQFAAPGARLVGAEPSEVVFMNSLTVNLHLMLQTFYRPTSDRAAILLDEPTFPSDRYAVESVIRSNACCRTKSRKKCWQHGAARSKFACSMR